MTYLEEITIKVPVDIVNTDYAYQNANNPGTMRGIIRIEQHIGVVQNIANAGYVQANTPSHVANSAALYSNGAFAQANAAFITANTPTNVANSAALYANGAFIQSNSAFSTANSSNTYSAANTTIWSGSAPTTMQAAIDRLANQVYTLGASTPIP